MLTEVFPIAAAGVLAAMPVLLAFGLLVTGMRNGDRPGDAKVSAVLVNGAQPQEDRPVIAVTVRNPSDAAVLVALRARRALLAGWVAGQHGVAVPWLTAGGRFRPGRYATVGVVQAGGAAQFAVPVTAPARRYLLTTVVGQRGGRLRVHWLRLGPGHYRARGRGVRFTSAPLP